jgi:hypothetical protein
VSPKREIGLMPQTEKSAAPKNRQIKPDIDKLASHESKPAPFYVRR